MKGILRRALATRTGRSSLHLLGELGFYPLKTYQTLRGIPAFVARHREFQRQARQHHHEFGPIGLRPHFADRVGSSGYASGHYFHQDLLVARKVFEHRPERHVDMGSRVDGFVAHVASFRQIEVFDVRPQSAAVHNIVFRQADLSDESWPFEAYCDSISSLHAVEHIGLGRYGDPPRYRGHVIALENIWKTLQPRGKFYFSVPMGKQRVEYDGERIFELRHLLELLDDRYTVDTFSYVGDDGTLREDVTLDDSAIDSSFGCEYGCAIFELTKR